MGCKLSTEKEDSRRRPAVQSPKGSPGTEKNSGSRKNTEIFATPPPKETAPMQQKHASIAVTNTKNNSTVDHLAGSQTASRDPDFGLGFEAKQGRRHSNGHLNSTAHSDLRTDISIYSSISTSPKKPKAKRTGTTNGAVQSENADAKVVKNGHHHHHHHHTDPHATANGTTRSNGVTTVHGLNSATDSTGNTFTDGNHDDIDHFLNDDEEEEDELYDQDDMQSVDEGDMDNLGNTMMEDLGQTVTIFHANIEPEVLAGLFAGGAELLAHKKPTSNRGRRSQGSRGSSPQGGWDVNDSITHSHGGLKSRQSRDNVEGNGDDDVTASGEVSSFETVSVASGGDEDDEDNQAATLDREESKVLSPQTLAMGNDFNTASAKFRIVRKREKSTNNFGSGLVRGESTVLSQGNYGEGSDAARMKNQDIETSVEPNSTAGKIISKRLHQVGSFNLAQLRKGADHLSKNMNEKPVLHMYDPLKDPRLADDEYEKAAKRRADQLSTCSDEVFSNHGSNGGSSPLQRNQFNASSVNLLASTGNHKDYGNGKSSAIGLEFCDVPSSWDLIKSIPDAVDKLNSGGVLFRYQVKRYKELTLSERIEMATFINLSQYADEDAENDQPILDFVNNSFTSPEEDLTEMLVICARLVLIVPNITSKETNVDVITSNEYQKLLAASDEVMEKPDRPRTFRKTKTVIKFIFSFRVQMSGSERADEDELARHVHHHDAKPNRLIILERTRKNRGRDSTLKSKACTLYYDLPPEGWDCGLGADDPKNKKLLKTPSGGGVMQSHTSIIIKSSVPSTLMAVMHKLGASVGNDALRVTPQERVFLTKKKMEEWDQMVIGGDFPEHPKVPWKI